MVKISLAKVICTFVIGATLIGLTNGLKKDAKSFVMTNVNTKNVIGQFEHYNSITEEDVKNSIMQSNTTLFDFKTLESLDDWQEISDTVRSVGESKAVLVLQKTQVFQRAIFFTLLNPQANGAGFAGVRTFTQWDLSNFKSIVITCKGQGSNQSYKVILRHNGYQSNADVSYEQFFTVMMSNKTFATVILPLANFKAYFRGKEVEDADPLNTSNITMFGLQVYGGVYSDIKQKGVSALEMENIVAIS